MWRMNEWPTAEGWYWFYGRDKVTARFGQAKALKMARVRLCANGVAVTVNNNFVWEKDMEQPYWFAPIEEPKPPEDNSGSQT